MWDAIIFTVHYGVDASAYQTEVDLLRKEGVFKPNVPLLVVCDPAEGMGSGGSTLNALLVLVEHLSAKRKLAVLNPDLIKESRLLIIHLVQISDKDVIIIGVDDAIASCELCNRQGRQLRGDKASGSMLPLPLWTTTDGGSSCLIRLTPLIHSYHVLTRSIAHNSPCGVWILGCDGLMVLEKGFLVDADTFRANDEILAFTINVDASFAIDHGAYHTDENGYVRSLEYRASSLGLTEGGCRQLVNALLFLPVDAACAMLSLHAVHPLTSTTYLGVDSGVRGFKLSLFFDFLLPTFLGANLSEFLSAEPSVLKWGDRVEHFQVDLLATAKRHLFAALHKFKTRTVLLKTTNYFYFNDTQMDKERLILAIANALAPAYVIETEICAKPDNSADDSLELIFRNNRDKDAETLCSYVVTVLKEDQTRSALAAVRFLVANGRQQLVLDTLDQALSTCGVGWRVCGRMFSCIADILGLMAGDDGGLRSGPASNPEWTHALSLLEDKKEECSFAAGVSEMRRLREAWSETPRRRVRAARHYEAAAQIAIRHAVMDVKRFLPNCDTIINAEGDVARRRLWHCAEVAARIDVSGGWSDTPPLTYEFGGAVVNIAVMVDGKKPIGTRCRASNDEETGIVFKSRDLSGFETTHIITDLSSLLAAHTNPNAPGSLICAVVIVSGLLKSDVDKSVLTLEQLLEERIGYRTFHVETWSLLPQGSGLGTSSILAGCLLACIWSFAGIPYEMDSLLHAVLYVEQVLTTGGGWQDQVGGLIAGIKIGRFGNTPESAQVVVEEMGERRQTKNVTLDAQLRGRLALIYTGRTRLAKNLLQEVIRNWYRREKITCDTVKGLVENAERCWNAVLQGDLDTFAVCCEVYREQKKVMAPGSEPQEIGALISALKTPPKPVAMAAWLAGAGGGGFLYVLLEDGMTVRDIEAVIAEHSEFSSMTVHSAEIDINPIIQWIEAESD